MKTKDRNVGAIVDGRVFLPAKLFMDDRCEAVLSLYYIERDAFIHDGELFVSSDWLMKQKPEYKEDISLLIGILRDRLKTERGENTHEN